MGVGWIEQDSARIRVLIRSFPVFFFSFSFLLIELRLSLSKVLHAALVSVTPYRSGLMNVYERECMTNRCTRDVFLCSVRYRNCLKLWRSLGWIGWNVSRVHAKNIAYLPPFRKRDTLREKVNPEHFRCFFRDFRKVFGQWTMDNHRPSTIEKSGTFRTCWKVVHQRRTNSVAQSPTLAISLTVRIDRKRQRSCRSSLPRQICSRADLLRSLTKRRRIYSA